MFANNVATTLAGSISSSATSLTLSSAQNLPSSIPSGQVLVITLNDVATRQNFEIIYATAISGATLSGLQRGQEGTAALAWLIGDFAFSGPTAGQQASFAQLGGNNTWTGSNTFSQPAAVAPAISPGQAVNLGQFASSLSTSGYKKYPDPNSPSGFFIEQWSSGTIASTGTGNTSALFNLPVAYPTAHLFCTASYSGNSPNGLLGAIAGFNYSPSQAEVTIYTSGAVASAGVQYWSKGY